jgi:hypothetical protein
MTITRMGLCVAILGFAVAVLVPLWTFTIIAYGGGGMSYDGVLYFLAAVCVAIAGAITTLGGLLIAFVGASRGFQKDPACNEKSAPATE